MGQSMRSRWGSKEMTTNTLLVHFMFLVGERVMGGHLIEAAPYKLSLSEDECLFEVGVNSMLGA